MYIKMKPVFCAFLTSMILLGGSAAYAAGSEPVSAPEIAVPLSNAAGILNIDLHYPETFPAGVSVDGNTITVTAQGRYRLTGSFPGGITVDADGPTELILDGVNLEGEACLQSLGNDAFTITLAENAQNILLDGLTAPQNMAKAVISAKGPLTIGGSGSLTISSGGSDALECKDGLTIAGGRLYLKAADEGIDARGPVTITGGNTRIASGGDGIAAEAGRITPGDIAIHGGALTVTAQARALDAEEGNITLTGGEVTLDSMDDGLRALLFHQSGGDLSITSQGDGIQTITALTITEGNISITSGEGGGNAINHSGGDMFGPPGRGRNQVVEEEDEPSTKGLKSDGDITITGGVIGLSTGDDSLHCARLCTIDGGELYIYSSDDAIHADDMILINGGDITVYDCFEGLEAFAVEVHGGNILLYAVNDCVNANGPEGWGGSGEAITDSVSGYDTTYYWQSDGWADYVVYSYGNNMGDGLDSNGSMYITGGHLTVSTPGTFMENGIDSGFGYFIISGGEVMAGGASAMQPTPSSNTDQCVAVISGISINAGTTIYVYDSEGGEIWNYTIPNYTSCLIVSHPDMVQGNTYTVTYGEQSTTLDFTTSNAISAGSFGGGPGGRGGRR